MAVVIYSPRYRIDLGLHVFPTEKYRLVYEQLRERGLIRPSEVAEPEAATWEELALVHTGDYLARLRDGTMTDDDVAQLEIPYSREMVEGFRVMVGGTIEAACSATDLDRRAEALRHTRRTGDPSRNVAQGFSRAIHIGGGLHHAFPNHGEGFCPFNDVAVAIRVLQSRGMERHAVIDLDVHHGNGTAFIFEHDPRVFTFSMHQQHNYPMWKPRGSLDVGLPDGAHDTTFLRELEAALPQVLAHQPACVFYLAGADPYEDDQLGGLRLTKDGLRRRDRLVLDAIRFANLPLVVVLAGGYARRVDDTVAIHVATIDEALRS
jgi:acetoin utilization deacetylase AcuC-like enzyme